MKIRKQKPQSATSIERSPRDDESHRMRRYILTMAVRTLCLVLMVVVTPYGWYSFVFAAGAVFLPYIAVVVANAAQAGQVSRAQPPRQRSLPGAPDTSQEAPGTVIRMSETRPSAGPDEERKP
ncbi:DUF3099 domain-containing protein [Microbacterium betulae]|uniref:DUF3099 domain-containing protein n=1 Tax=Microbacterium betulae TaxID=2981139 RepID=A0AA97I5N4_9MICO|nr:DUF3099 domain-containing protein [Microbacterium sp. AB]WOF21722.1 DUF3099 domain-containing protein [Microbacterium sp. AB]